ncbi:unannotated protein [freshwater metagenome]|uniref:Unannotated protein n=1 Tax=freshwater metagenome TaxID=449393 RepID=A0A6J7P570_9ZZZZ
MPHEEEVVRRAPLFTALDEAAAVSLRASMDTVKIAKGSILFKEGDDGEHLYVIIDGKLKLGTSSGDGRENLLSILGPGEMFGELSLFDPGPRTSTATAVTDARLLSLAMRKLFLGSSKIQKFHFNCLQDCHNACVAQMKRSAI